MKIFHWTFILLTAFLTGCGGGGGNPGTCSGSAIYCEENGLSAGDRTNLGSVQAGVFTKTGSGDSTFDIPSGVTRIRIQASTDTSANFIVRIDGRLFVNEILGGTLNPQSFDGTYSLQGGGTTEIVNSSGVKWTFTEVD